MWNTGQIAGKKCCPGKFILLKTERLMLTFRRLLCHYKKGTIRSYPGEVDSFMHLDIPIVRNNRDINGSIFRELYELGKEISR